MDRYFQEHRRDYHGTEYPSPTSCSMSNRQTTLRLGDTAVAAAGQLRQRIVAGELTFAEAARQHSTAPTAADGGRIGFIGRRQPMPESFSQAAFALEPGAISPCFITTFGVHLIQCLEIKPGANAGRTSATSWSRV